MAATDISTIQSTSGMKRGETHGYDLDREDGKNPRVLVVDDDPDFIVMAKLILRRAGFDVAGAAGCQAALEKCAEVNPDVILLDLMMPNFDGYQTFEKLKSVTHAPVIVVTANGNRENAARSLQAGMDDYISKPFHNTELVARLRAVMRRTKKPAAEKLSVFPEVGLIVKHDYGEVYLHDRYIRLAPREFSVFSALAELAPRPVMYRTLTEKMWGEDNRRTRAHLKNLVFSIRQKIEAEPSNPRLLINYRSLGYRLLTRSESVRS